MKNSIKVIFIILIAFLSLNMQNAFSQSYDYAEILIVNNTGNGNGFPITIDVYPVGAIFNGDNTGGYTGQYTPVAKHPGSLNNYIYGVNQFPLPNQTNQQYYTKINFDKSPDYQGCHFSLGYGKYRIDFYVNSVKTFSCNVDFSDANYTGTTIPNQYIQQFKIEYRDNGTVWAKFNDLNASYYQIENTNPPSTFVVWEQLGTLNPPLTPNKGDFTDSQDPNTIYHSFPLDATSFGYFAHETPEEVYLNVKMANYDANLIANKTLIFNNVFLK